MSPTPTELRQRRILLVVLATLVIGGAVAVAASVAAEAYATRLASLETTVERAATLATLGARVPALEKRLAEVRAELASVGIDSDSPGVVGSTTAGAPSQTLPASTPRAGGSGRPAAAPTSNADPTLAISRTVERAAVAAGTRLDRVVPSRDETSQSVQFQLSGTRRALLSTLATLATDAPNLSVDTLTIAAGRRVGEARLSMVVQNED